MGIECFPGIMRLIVCESCNTEFELTLEPHAAKPGTTPPNIAQDAERCPFCGGELADE